MAVYLTDLKVGDKSFWHVFEVLHSIYLVGYWSLIPQAVTQRFLITQDDCETTVTNFVVNFRCFERFSRSFQREKNALVDQKKREFLSPTMGYSYLQEPTPELVKIAGISREITGGLQIWTSVAVNIFPF